jgi:hypothetical protein
MLQREKKGPKDGVQSARNLPTWKIGLQKDIQLETSCQITKTKKKSQCFTYLESVYVTWMMSYTLSCISSDQLQDSNPCVETWHNESFHVFL